jgi:hypothetical protein
MPTVVKRTSHSKLLAKRQPVSEAIMPTRVSAAHLSKLAHISMVSVRNNDPAKATFSEID